MAEKDAKKKAEQAPEPTPEVDETGRYIDGPRPEPEPEAEAPKEEK